MDLYSGFAGFGALQDMADAMEAVQSNNAALAVKHAKRYHEAIQLHM
jgi:hypothetical protein